MFAQLTKWIKPSALQTQANLLYTALVAQARQPFFYRDWQVADSIDGRFDLIVLHVFLLSKASSLQPGEPAQALVQEVVDRMCADMDESLREMGVGDVSIGKKVQKMAYALNGRMQRYDESWDDQAALILALAQNLYRDAARVSDASTAMLADYCYRTVTYLQGIDLTGCQSIDWPHIA